MTQEHKKAPRGIAKGTLPASAEHMLNDLVTGPMTPAAMQDVFTQLKKALIERALGAELGQHLGFIRAGSPSLNRARISAMAAAPRPC